MLPIIKFKRLHCHLPLPQWSHSKKANVSKSLTMHHSIWTNLTTGKTKKKSLHDTNYGLQKMLTYEFKITVPGSHPCATPDLFLFVFRRVRGSSGAWHSIACFQLNYQWLTGFSWRCAGVSLGVYYTPCATESKAYAETNLKIKSVEFLFLYTFVYPYLC